MKLTAKQKEHLEALLAGERGSYPGLHMGVLNSLSLKGLVAAKYSVGSTFSPSTAIKWRLTEAGRALLSGTRG